jgi:hypothetical protein
MDTRLENMMTPTTASGRLGVYRYSSHCGVAMVKRNCGIISID